MSLYSTESQRKHAALMAQRNFRKLSAAIAKGNKTEATEQLRQLYVRYIWNDWGSFTQLKKVSQ